jgi:hypothetical protein
MRKWLRILVLAGAGLAMVMPSIATAQDGLVLWNTLGSDEEVLNSGFGPDLEFYCCGGGIHVQGDAGYAPGVFGNAVTLAGCPYFSMARVHNLVLDNLPAHLSPEQGTIEVWYKQTEDPVPYQHNPYRIFGGSYGLGSGMAFQSQGDPGPPRLQFGLWFWGTSAQVTSLDDGLPGYDISPLNGTWIHIAAVWDRAGIQGTQETLQLYVDGVRVASTTEDAWGTIVGSQVDICGANDVDACDNFFMDNIKVWDFAKTDFADRFLESPLESVPALDIKPGSCPNSFNRNSHGVLPAALVGTESFDVTQVVISSLRLKRADDPDADGVAPNEGPPGPHSEIEHVATPFEGELCNCHELTGDDLDDLMMHFKTDLLVPALDLNAFDPGALVELCVTGELDDESTFLACDCIRLVPPGTAPGLLAIQSNAPGAWIEVSPLDNTLDGGGFANFERFFPQTTVVTLTAEPSANAQPFMGWWVNGVEQNADAYGTRPQTAIQVTIGGHMRVKAVYGQSPDSWGGDLIQLPPGTGRD